MNAIPKTIYASSHRTRTHFAPLKARKRRSQSLVSFFLKKRCVASSEENIILDPLLHHMAKQIATSVNEKIIHTWTISEDHGVIYTLIAHKKPDRYTWKMCPVQGYAWHLSVSILQRLTALVAMLGSWIFVILPAGISISEENHLNKILHNRFVLIMLPIKTMPEKY